MSDLIYQELSLPSSDGKNTLFVNVSAPPSGKIRGVIQLSHGMIDHSLRYRKLAEYFCSLGYVFAGNDHLGHGKTAASPDDFGFFAEKDGVDLVLADLNAVNAYLHKTYPGLPVILFGHSMGSFLCRLYAAKYPDTIDALIIHGTGGPNPALPAGKALGAIVSLFRGPRHRSTFIAKLAFAGYNSHYDKSEGLFAWLTRDAEVLAHRDEDPYTQFIFTVSGYRDLFRMVGRCNGAGWYKAFPKEMPTLVISGGDDPVGNYGKGPALVYKRLLKAGAKDVSLRIYPGARHELFNETNADEVFADLSAFADKVTK